SVPYNLDYHVLATTYSEPFIRSVRKGMKAAGIGIESSKGEAWPGQQEINFRFADALTMADNHVVYKNGIKEMAHQQGCSVTFMAKPDHTWIGSSCHVHSSLWHDGRNTFDGESETFRQYLAGQIACMSELAIFIAPNINSYKRYAAGTWAPTTLAWGHDNRTCGFRIVGHGQHLRTETRIPGADVNPYLAFAALLAAGLYGIENKLELPPAFTGNAYESNVQRFPHTLREAIGALEQGKVARKALGEDVVDHYLNYARTELARLETANAGKPLADSRWEMGMVADVFHFYAGAIDKHYGETIPVAGGVDMTFREALGVVGLIVPWNFPLMLASWKLGPALACGNTVVLKPAELTPLTALRFAEIALEAGLPEGVVNVVVGPGSTVGERLIAHPDVAKIGFTGSTEVGQRVMEGAAKTIKRVTLEL